MCDLVGQKILLNGRKLAVVSYCKNNGMMEVLVLKNSCEEEFIEGSRLTLTENYLDEIGFEIIKE
jgi:hypothetical protein